MFEQTIYTLLSAKFNADGSAVEWQEEGVKAIEIKDGKIMRVTTDRDSLVDIDDTTTFARRATGMFDKLGQMLFGGDLVKFMQEHAGNAPIEVIAPIVWINGAYCIAIEGVEEQIYLTQHNVMQIEKIGNIYQHGKILEKPIDEAVFEGTTEAL